MGDWNAQENVSTICLVVNCNHFVSAKDTFKQCAWEWEVEISEQVHWKAMEFLKKDHVKEVGDLGAKVR